jgi:NADH-quinone oxidoreductase subunit H
MVSGYPILNSCACIFSFIIPLLLTVALLTLAERKVLASVQRRKGPNVVGFLGLMQPFADGFKLLIKETILPSTSSKFLFIFSPIFTLFVSLISWSVVPFSEGLVFSDLNLGLLYLFAVSSLGVYGIILSGWASNSRYAFLGSLRSASQMISYEVSFALILVSLISCASSLNLSTVVLFQKNIWFIVPFFPLFFMFFVSILAETNRSPFDLPEAEAELVSGYNVEYSAAGFALFFVSEYCNIILMSSLCVVLFFGGWLSPFPFWEAGFFWFSVKLLVFLFLFVWVRASFPRYRYDQLMRLGWKVFLPLSLGWCVMIPSFVFIYLHC